MDKLLADREEEIKALHDALNIARESNVFYRDRLRVVQDQKTGSREDEIDRLEFQIANLKHDLAMAKKHEVTNPLSTDMMGKACAAAALVLDESPERQIDDGAEIITNETIYRMVNAALTVIAEEKAQPYKSDPINQRETYDLIDASRNLAERKMP